MTFFAFLNRISFKNRANMIGIGNPTARAYRLSRSTLRISRQKSSPLKNLLKFSKPINSLPAKPLYIL